MSYDWNASLEGGESSEKIPAGQNIRVGITKIVYGKKGGAPFKSKSGDPQIMVIFSDDQEREVSQMYTLSKKAAWVLARLLSRFGANLEDLKNSGVEPIHFANPTIASTHLIGRTGRINLSYNAAGYAEVDPCEMDAAVTVQDTKPAFQKAAAETAAYTKIDQSDIPF